MIVVVCCPVVSRVLWLHFSYHTHSHISSLNDMNFFTRSYIPQQMECHFNRVGPHLRWSPPSRVELRTRTTEAIEMSGPSALGWGELVDLTIALGLMAASSLPTIKNIKYAFDLFIL